MANVLDRRVLETSQAFQQLTADLCMGAPVGEDCVYIVGTSHCHLEETPSELNVREARQARQHKLMWARLRARN